MASGNGSTGGTETKVGRLIDGYDLGPEYGAELEAAWTDDGVERKSLRDLAEEFNRKLLAAAMSGAGMSTLDGEVDNIFRLLTEDDVTAGTRTDARSRLERNGIDVDQLERDFVTYQAIRLFVSVDVLCEGCGSQYTIAELLERGGCDCDEVTDGGEVGE
jgi:hypothetical protein